MFDDAYPDIYPKFTAEPKLISPSDRVISSTLKSTIGSLKVAVIGIGVIFVNGYTEDEKFTSGAVMSYTKDKFAAAILLFPRASTAADTGIAIETIPSSEGEILKV